jgi:hypothetical protein
MSFQSFYWQGATIPIEELSNVERLGDPDVSASECKAALMHLLGSSSSVARGIALDYYSFANASGRQGHDPLVDDVAIDAAARACALRELSQPPYERIEANAKPKCGANHASALRALWFNADPADAALVARALLENKDERVLETGVGAAEPVLRGEPAHPALFDALLRIANRGDIDPRIRGAAISAIGGASDETVEPLLVQALANPDLAVSASAAHRLLERDLERYRPVVKPVAAAWRTGDSPPFDAHEVRRMLDEEVIEAAGVRLALTDAAFGLQLDPVRPFEALAWVANDWIHGTFPRLLEHVQRGEDATSSRGSVVRVATADITAEQSAIWFDATGTDVGDDPVLIRSDMTPRPLLLPRRALVEILQALELRIR